MNGYVGQNRAFTGGYRMFTKISQIPKPSNTWVFIDEREDGINDGWFAVNMEGYDPLNPNAYIMVDYPASYHKRAGGLSFADGHSEIRKWVDGRTIPVLRPGTALPLNVSSPGNIDVDWLQTRSTVRVSGATRD